MKKLILIVCSILLSACVSVGTSFKWENVRSVEVGDTKSELNAKMGAPYSVSSRGKQEIWVWTWVGSFGAHRTVSFILEDNKVKGVPTVPDEFK